MMILCRDWGGAVAFTRKTKTSRVLREKTKFKLVVLLWTTRLPDKQEVGQPLHSLKGVTMQSILQGKGQDRIESGREDSGHLKYIPV